VTKAQIALAVALIVGKPVRLFPIIVDLVYFVDIVCLVVFVDNRFLEKRKAELRGSPALAIVGDFT
jgi:hypothetical protein